LEAYIVNYYYHEKDKILQRSDVIYAENAEAAKLKFIEAHKAYSNYQLMIAVPAKRPRQTTQEQMECLIKNCNAVIASTKRALEALTTSVSLLTRIARDMGFNAIVDEKSGEILIGEISSKGLSV
jgi:hypothetical protein